MILPQWLQDKVNGLYQALDKKTLVETRENLTNRYKNQTGQNKSLIESKTDSMLYAISRMPATFSVVYTLVRDLANQGAICDVSSVLDIGSGTGAGYFALKELDESLEIDLVERDRNMVEIFKTLTDGAVDVNVADASTYVAEKPADLVMTSYVLSEMTEDVRNRTFDNLAKSSNKYVLVIDTGTPKTYADMMKLKDYARKIGWNVVAPCMAEKCPLKDDYCQFYARVERSSLHKLAKGGSLSYEDEKYFYLLFSKEVVNGEGARVIRRPMIKENNISLVLCSKEGVESKMFTKKNKELFKKAKKAKINEII